MTAKKGPAPAGLEPRVARKLLDLLATDDDFRSLFQADAHAALVQAGYEAPAGTDPAMASSVSGADCMQLASSDRIASKSQILRDREKLIADTTTVMRFSEAGGFKAV